MDIMWTPLGVSDSKRNLQFQIHDEGKFRVLLCNYLWRFIGLLGGIG
jgi:hypothetical protein